VVTPSFFVVLKEQDIFSVTCPCIDLRISTRLQGTCCTSALPSTRATRGGTDDVWKRKRVHNENTREQAYTTTTEPIS